MPKKSNLYKKTLLNILYIYIGFSLLIVANLYAAFNWTGDNIDANSSVVNDVWTLTGNVTSTVGIIGATNSGAINVASISSELFGDFTKLSGDIILNNSVVSTKCGTGEVTYEISGNLVINSSWWGNMDLVQTGPNYSYYCPGLNYMGLTFFSNTLGSKIIGGDAGVLGIIFNASEVSIKGLADVRGDLNNLSSDVVNGQEILNLETNSVEGKLLNVTTAINKNIVLATKQKSGITSIDTIGIFNNTGVEEDFYYYDYEGQTGADNLLGNQGQNLIIDNGGTLLTNQISVTGKNTVIVEGGNVYIKGDIFTTNDSNDILVIIAKRDSTNKQNGGNIYVDPSVTNIDAVLVADGSLIGYDGVKALNSKVDAGVLFRQLLIHGSVMTKNTIGEDISIYGTDEYIANSGNSVLSEYYNLANFRLPKLAYASYVLADDCGGDDSKVIIGTATTPILNAWAGKRECFYDGPQNASTVNLRTVNGKVNPLVIEYNSNIKSINPFILRDN